MDDITQAGLEREFPNWRIRRGVDQLCHATRREGAALVATGEDWTDLRDEIIRKESKLAAGLKETWWLPPQQ